MGIILDLLFNGVVLYKCEIVNELMFINVNYIDGVLILGILYSCSFWGNFNCVCMLDVFILEFLFL